MMQSQNLSYETLTAAHADELLGVLTTPGVLAFIDPEEPPLTLKELQTDYGIRAKGPYQPISPTEQWFNVVVRLKMPPALAIGRLEATGYGAWGELAYLLGEAWWGKGLAYEAMLWWQEYLAAHSTETQWWATVHPQNQRSIRLLMRLGYQEVNAEERPRLQSYDEGDRCFVLNLS
ncbi:MAG: GNAT family N-acetyltransferase [Oculatellaceae cyanobacterium Prado106]|nr:GNAT family N-acetyltransferase [Oculatellaceae cyanobacterium Prado106]